MRKNTVAKQGKQNTKISNIGKKSNQKPKVKTSQKGNWILPQKREFLFNIATPQSGAFVGQKLEVNPGLKGTFPWLSQIAPSFQKYRFKKLAFIFETAVSTFSNGMIMMAPVFNLNYPVPSSKTKLLELTDAVRGPLWENFRVDITSSQMNVYNEYFIRQEAKTETKLYDPFYLVYAVDSPSIDVPYVGELWVEYQIELLEPAYIDEIDYEFGLYKHFEGTQPSNDEIFRQVTIVKGGLDVEVTSPTTLQFNEEFTGMIYYVINQANLGLASDISGLSGIDFTLTSESGTALGFYAVGGNGYGADNNGWTFGSIGLKDLVKGDSLTFKGNIFYADTSTELANAFYIDIMKGVDLYNPPTPSEVMRRRKK